MLRLAYQLGLTTPNHQTPIMCQCIERDATLAIVLGVDGETQQGLANAVIITRRLLAHAWLTHRRDRRPRHRP